MALSLPRSRAHRLRARAARLDRSASSPEAVGLPRMQPGGTACRRATSPRPAATWGRRSRRSRSRGSPGPSGCSQTWPSTASTTPWGSPFFRASIHPSWPARSARSSLNQAGTSSSSIGTGTPGPRSGWTVVSWGAGPATPPTRSRLAPWSRWARGSNAPSTRLPPSLRRPSPASACSLASRCRSARNWEMALPICRYRESSPSRRSCSPPWSTRSLVLSSSPMASLQHEELVELFRADALLAVELL